MSSKNSGGPDAEGVWIPVVVRVGNKCFIVSAFCNTGFGYPKDKQGNPIREACIALPASLMLLEGLINYGEFMDALLLRADLFSVDGLENVDVALLDKDVEFRWVGALLWGHTKRPRRILLNPELWTRLGVAYDTRYWRERLWFPIENPDKKKESVRALVFNWEFMV